MTEFLSSATAERLVLSLAHFLWQGTLLCLLYPLVVNSNLVRTPRGRYLFGLSLFCVMAVCPIVTYWQLGQVPILSPSQSNFTLDIASATSSAQSPGLSGLSPAGLQLILSGWLVGVFCLSLRLLGGYRQLRKWRLETLDLPERLQAQLQTLCRRLGMQKIPEVRLSVHVTEALALGFWKPVILVPVSWVTALPTSTLEAIIAHELAHIRRFDLWVNLGQRFVETLLFYHPAVWWLSNRIREEREFCCDELAAETTGESLGYALALEGVARYLAGSHTLLGTSFLGDGKMKLLKRVRHVLGQSSSTKRIMWWPAGVMALMLPIGIYGTSLTAQDPPREGDRPRAEREEGRRDGDRERPPREGDRPRGEAERPRPPRDGERPPREGDGPPRGPRDGERPPRGEGERGERDLYREIQLLREEVARLREELHRQGPPPPRDGFGPRPGAGPFRDGEGPPRGPFGRMRDGEGPPPDGFRPPRDGEGPPRDGFRPPRDGEGPPRGEGDRPPREGERGPRGEGDRPRPRRDGEGPPRDGFRLPRDGEGPPRGEGDRPPRDGERPPRGEGDRPRAEGERPVRGAGPERPPREGDRPRGEGERPPRGEGDRPPREGERPPREGDRPREEGPERPLRPDTET